MLPNNTAFDLSTFEEVQRYSDMAMLCINFLESAISLGVTCLDETDVFDEKRWLYGCILKDVRDCLYSIDEKGLSALFPKVPRQVGEILAQPFLYAQYDLHAIKNAYYISFVKH